MKRVSAALIGMALILAAMNTAYAVSYTFKAFDFPNAYTNWASSGTRPLGINNAGTTVGYYYTGVNAPNSMILQTHAFIQNGTAATSFDYFNEYRCSTYANGINDAGTVVGQYEDMSGYSHGFTLSSGVYHYFDYGPIFDLTFFYGINNAGTIVGTNCLRSDMSQCTGFSLNGGSRSTVIFPGSTYTFPTGINDAGTIVGWYNDANGAAHGFTLSGTTYTSFDHPDAHTTVFTGINNAGTIVGNSWSNADATRTNRGFALTGTTYTSFDFPGANYTTFTGINNAGMVVGFYGANNGAHAFVATPNTGDPDGIDWAMPDHLVAGSKFNAAVSLANNSGILGHDSVYPPGGWVVDLILTRNNQPVGTADGDPLVEWRWEVTPAAAVIATPAPGGKSSMTVQELGTYSVTAKKYTRATAADAFTFDANGVQLSQTVLVRDFLIVGLGDSNGSGEGNPPWIYAKCDRSQDSYQFKSALYVEQRDPHSSVTFLFPACSGARIENLGSAPYPGINPDQKGDLDPQISQVAQLLKLTGAPGEPKTPRKADAVILSAGINNLYFGSLMSFCTIHGVFTPCQDIHARLDPDISATAAVGDREFVVDANSNTTVADILSGLQTGNLDWPWYASLNGDLTKPVSEGGLGVAANHVIITQYPDFTHDGYGNTCNTKIGAFSNMPKWDTSTWSWLSAQAGILNATVAQTAKYGWQVAALDQSLFSNHGYCAGNFLITAYPWPPFVDTVPIGRYSYFLGAFEGISNRNRAGGFHPLKAAHGITANAVEPLLCNALFGNTTCQGPPTQ